MNLQSQKKLGSRDNAPVAGRALATLAGEEEPFTFAQVLGDQNFQKYLPVDDEAVNKGVEQFRGHIKQVLRPEGADHFEEFIGCMGFSEEEVRKLQQEDKKVKERRERASKLTEGAEREIREAEMRRKQEKDRLEKELNAQRNRVQQETDAMIQQARERAQRGVPGGAPPVRGRGPPPKGPPGQPGAPQQWRGPPPGNRGPPRGPPPGRGPNQAPRGAPPPKPTPAPPKNPANPPPQPPPKESPKPKEAPVIKIADIKADPVPSKASERVVQQSANFIEKVHSQPSQVTKGDIEAHRKHLEDEVTKMKSQVINELNDRYRKALAETSTLQEVKSELAKVDQVIAADVFAIRAKIDQSASELFEAQRRFDQAESEFIAAKLEVKMCEEYKMELTEYMCLLIQENQRRKTEKLEELSATLAGVRPPDWGSLTEEDLELQASTHTDPQAAS